MSEPMFERLDEGAPMLGPHGGMLFLTTVVDDRGADLRWGGPDIEAQSWEAAQAKAADCSHDFIAGYLIGYAACGQPVEPALRLVERAVAEGRTLRLRVDGIVHERFAA